MTFGANVGSQMARNDCVACSDFVVLYNSLAQIRICAWPGGNTVFLRVLLVISNINSQPDPGGKLSEAYIRA